MKTKHRFQDEWLLRAALKIPGVTEQLVENFRAQQKASLAATLAQAGLASPERLGRAVRDTYKIRFVEPKPDGIDKFALSLIPERVCRRHRLLPLRLKENTIELAMANPLDPDALSDVQEITGRSPVPHYSPQDHVVALIDQAYNSDRIINDILERFEHIEPIELVTEKGAARTTAALDAEGPVVRLVNAVISKAVQLQASDIHLEHDERCSHIRYRVDGLLRNILTLPRLQGAGSVVSRIKIMADLDVSKRRLPQDGRARLRVGPGEIDLRISTLPTTHGEKIVIRILDRRVAEVPLDRLGIAPDIARRLKKILEAQQGMFLVTGPTGSGKTTTLYSILNSLKAEDTNIVTIEDPIEYKLDGVNQVQVNEKQGLTFPVILRSVLRQDPDVIMLGEIRDRETADIAFQAALTGHLVLSTLHTNDTIGTVIRLADMGVERFKLAPALLAVTAQRLVRRLCPACRAAVPGPGADPETQQALSSQGLPETYYRAVGCPQCGLTGFKGRLPLIELFEVVAEMRERLGRDDEGALRKAAVEGGVLRTLLADALSRLSAGDTALEEIRPHVSLQAGRLQPVAQPRPAASKAARVLIVDDDPAMRAILRALLQGQEFAVEEAEDGISALARLSRETPDLLVLDLQMPGLDGYAVISGLRRGLGLLRLPIIVLTSASDDKSQEQALSLGADDYIIKPFHPAIVLARIKAAIARPRY